MKSFWSSFLVLLVACQIQAQIIITANDFGEINDTVRYSNASVINNNLLIAADTNQLWDFSTLTPISQSFSKYQSVASTSLIYAFTFGSSANLASPRQDMGMMGINITESFNFYNKNSNDYRLVGYGGNANGTPLPVSFNNPDIQFRFPMAYGNQDSSNSDWNISVPNLGYLGETLFRKNTVDAWGTLIIPYGTFECLRVKSEVTQIDTVYMTSSSIGYLIPQNYIEYTWFAKNMNFPIMKATISAIGPSSIIYMDSLRLFASIESASGSDEVDFSVFPNPANESFQMSWKTKEQVEIQVFSTNGKLIFDKIYTKQEDAKVETTHWLSGSYVVKFWDGQNTMVKKLIIE